MMTETYVRRHHHADADVFASWAADAGLPIVGVENVPGADPIESARLPSACVLVFGQEGPGLSPDLRRVCATLLAITQYGSTRSMNAGAAAAIAMHTWIRQHAESR
jgi:tRNA G18 (ribose-2'-O)-methylase SpoU